MEARARTIATCPSCGTTYGRARIKRGYEVWGYDSVRMEPVADCPACGHPYLIEEDEEDDWDEYTG